MDYMDPNVHCPPKGRLTRSLARSLAHSLTHSLTRKRFWNAPRLQGFTCHDSSTVLYVCKVQYLITRSNKRSSKLRCIIKSTKLSTYFQNYVRGRCNKRPSVKCHDACKHTTMCLNWARTGPMPLASARFWPSWGTLWHVYWDVASIYWLHRSGNV